ncbi:hypothetical protein M8J77_022348 [Diaphorina citri]|nr:hypothetical protein M8J77_022508 [Diaphorina citri]KAI5718512.1 hypothetical protein M8J77_022348 [Diaphorina citri]
MAVDFKRFEINATVSVTNIQYLATLMHHSDYEPFYLCDPLVPQNRDENLRDVAKTADDFRFDTELTDSSNWLVSAQRVESPKRVHSYTNDDELKEIFTQMDSALLSTSNSEVTLERALSETTLDSVEMPFGAKWNTELWKKYYDSHKAGDTTTKPEQVETSELDYDALERERLSNQDPRERRHDLFECVKFDRKTIEELRNSRPDLGVAVAESIRSNDKISEPEIKIKKRKFQKYTYEDYETWLFKNLTPKQIKEYRKRQQLKLTFTPAYISNRMTNRLNHTEVYQAMRPEKFKKLDFKYKPHMKFPVFGEGKYSTTAVSKNFTFTPTEQMAINHANYVLDQRIKKLKNRKSMLSEVANEANEIRFDQSSSYINRMREYRRIHMENKKIAKKFNPDLIKNPHSLGYKKSSMSSFGKSSASSLASTKSSASRFSTKMYTKAYDRKTVQRLVNSENPYAPDKSPSKLSKKHKRPEWDVGHVDYRKTEVKPIKYKSIRKLPVCLSNSNSTASTKSVNGFGNTTQNGAPTKPNKPAPPLRSKALTVNSNGLPKLETHGKFEKKNATLNITSNGVKSVNRNNAPNSVKAQPNIPATLSRATSFQELLNKSKIPVRKWDRSKNIDLNDTKFKVFQSLNNELFGAYKENKTERVVRNEEKRKDTDSARKVENDAVNMSTCQNLVNGDKNVALFEIGGGDAIDLTRLKNIDITGNYIHNNTHHVFEKSPITSSTETFGCSLESSHHPDDDSLLSDNEDTLSRTSSVSLDKEWDTPSPRLLSPIARSDRQYLEKPPLLPYNLVTTYSNTLDIISERTESSISDGETSLNADIVNARLEERPEVQQNERYARLEELPNVPNEKYPTGETLDIFSENQTAGDILFRDQTPRGELRPNNIATVLHRINATPTAVTTNIFSEINADIAGGRLMTAIVNRCDTDETSSMEELDEEYDYKLDEEQEKEELDEEEKEER